MRVEQGDINFVRAAARDCIVSTVETWLGREMRAKSDLWTGSEEEARSLLPDGLGAALLEMMRTVKSLVALGSRKREEV